jgi:hypothetical protein
MSNFENFPYDIHSHTGFADNQTNDCSEPLNIDIQELLNFSCNEYSDLDLGPSSKWSASATHGNINWNNSEDM